MKNLLMFLAAASLIYVGCTTSSSPSPCPGLPDVKDPYTISGHLVFKSPVSIPSDAKVICYWGGLSATQSAFSSSRVFGQGTLNMADSSFSVTFQGVPPNTESVTQDCKSVKLSPPGYVLLVSGQRPGNWFDTVRVLGAIDQSAMIYCITNTTLHSWFGNFVQGYGIGIDTSAITDTLIRIPNTGLKLSVDSAYTDFLFPHDWTATVQFR